MGNYKHKNPSPSRWRVRVYRGRYVLLASFLVLAIFLFAQNITIFHFLLGFLIIAASILLSPPKRNKSLKQTNKNEKITYYRDKNLFEFCDILSEPCFILDKKTVILHINERAKNQFPNSKISSPLSFSLRSPLLLSAIEKALETSKAQNTTIHQTVPNEQWFDVFISFYPQNSADKEYSRLIIIMHDITGQKKLEKMRADFIANASHELRTPLTSIIGFIETLQQSKAKDEKRQNEFLEIMQRQAQRMSKLIDDLLSLSRIELSQHVKPKGKVDLVNIINNVVDSLRFKAKEEGLTLAPNIKEKSAIISGDEDELFELFENIIDNAIKYGGTDNNIEIILAPHENEDYDFKINIIDYGIGISEKDLPRLTERFYRVDEESSRKKKGTGLGLAIVKHILSRHGAKMKINSQIGKGTNVELLFRK